MLENKKLFLLDIDGTICKGNQLVEGTNKSKRKNDKNAKKYHESFASCEVI